MLLGEADLVGHGWEVTEERSWPTGGLDPESEKSKRAVEAGGITAWRSLADAGSPRTAWFEVVPYASPADAELSLRQVPRFFVGTDRPDETVVAERVVDDQVLPGSTDTWIYEKSTTGPQGDRLARYVGGTVDHILVPHLFHRSGGDVVVGRRVDADRASGRADPPGPHRRVRSGRTGGVRPVTRGRRSGPGRPARARPVGGGGRGGGRASRWGRRPSA